MVEISPARVYTVSEITQDIKLLLENNFAEVWVEGEVSNFTPAASGHFYFSLKDAQAVLQAVMFKSANKTLAFKIEDGLKVICLGRVDLYPPRGQYQLIVERVEPKGVGARQLAFEQLKKKLFNEGLFDPAHKRELPLMPFRTGIVTSASGAAIRDILQILKKGAPFVDVVIRSVRVQGEHSAAEIAEGIGDLNALGDIDVIIISRGGGSAEDLWSFNEEIVARAVYASAIPVISAVGHQINTTLCDMTADVFVETPSAAAKIFVDKKNALCARVEGYGHEMNFSVSEIISSLHKKLLGLRVLLKSPLDRLQEKEQLLDEIVVQLNNNLRQYIEFLRARAHSLIERLEALSPLSVLARGFSLSTHVLSGQIIKDIRQIKPEDEVKTIIKNGAFISLVKEVIDDKGKAGF